MSVSYTQCQLAGLPEKLRKGELLLALHDKVDLAQLDPSSHALRLALSSSNDDGTESGLPSIGTVPGQTGFHPITAKTVGQMERVSKSSARTMRMGGVDGCVMPNLFFFLLDFQSANTLKTPFALERPTQSTLPSH
jgi:hypothetical protein